MYKRQKKFRTVGPHSEGLYHTIEARFGRAKLTQLYALLAELNEAIEEPEEVE